MDQVWANPRYDVVYHLTLERERNLYVFQSIAGIYLVQVEKCPVFGKMDPVVGHFVLNRIQSPTQHRNRLNIEHSAIIRHGDVHIGALFIQCADKGCGNIGKSTGFGR